MKNFTVTDVSPHTQQQVLTKETESTTLLAIDSKQQSLTPAKKTKTHRVLMVYSQWGEQAALRILDIEATGKREAKALASTLLCRLEPDQIDAVTLEAHEWGYDFIDPEILDVWKTRDIVGHAWTRAEIESENVDALVNQAAAQLENGNEQSEGTTGQMKKANATTDIIEQFDTMTAKQHARMKRKLLHLADSGADKPEVDTLEGYALAQYTTANLGGVELN